MAHGTRRLSAVDRLFERNLLDDRRARKPLAPGGVVVAFAALGDDDLCLSRHARSHARALSRIVPSDAPPLQRPSEPVDITVKTTVK